MCHLHLWCVRWRGRGGRFWRRRPVQQVLVHLIPSPCPIRRWLEMPPYLPVACHGSPPDEMSHRGGRQLSEGGNDTAAGSDGAGTDRCGSGKICAVEVYTWT